MRFRIFGVTDEEEKSGAYAFLAGIFAGVGGVLGNAASTVGQNPQLVYAVINCILAPWKIDQCENCVSFVKWKFLMMMALFFVFTWMLYGLACNIVQSHSRPFVISCTTTVFSAIGFGSLLYNDYDGTLWWSSFGLTAIGTGYLFPGLWDSYYVYIKHWILQEQLAEERETSRDN